MGSDQNENHPELHRTSIRNENGARESVAIVMHLESEAGGRPV